MTGRVMIRFLQSAKETNDQALFLNYRTELEFIR